VALVLDILEELNLLFDGCMTHVTCEENLTTFSGFINLDGHVFGGKDALVVRRGLIEVNFGPGLPHGEHFFSLLSKIFIAYSCIGNHILPLF
jgi:hypothetical protein